MAFLLPCTRPLMLPGALPISSSVCLQTFAECMLPQTMADLIVSVELMGGNAFWQ